MEGRDNDKGGRREADEGKGNVEEEEGGREEGLERGTQEDEDINDVFEPAEAKKGRKEEGREENDGGREEREEAGRDEETETEGEGREGRMCSTWSFPRNTSANKNTNHLVKPLATQVAL